MNRLDTEAQKVIGPLLPLRSQIIQPDDQHTLATWTTKIAVVLDYAEPKATGAVDPSVHKTLYEECRPPDEAHIWIAADHQALPAVSDCTIGTHRDSVSGDKIHDKLYISTFRIDHAIFQIFLPDPDSGWLPVREGFDDFVLQLWPSTSQPVSWPPRKIFQSDRGIRALAVSFIAPDFPF